MERGREDTAAPSFPILPVPPTRPATLAIPDLPEPADQHWEIAPAIHRVTFLNNTLNQFEMNVIDMRITLVGDQLQVDQEGVIYQSEGSGNNDASIANATGQNFTTTTIGN